MAKRSSSKKKPFFSISLSFIMIIILGGIVFGLAYNLIQKNIEINNLKKSKDYLEKTLPNKTEPYDAKKVKSKLEMVEKENKQLLNEKEELKKSNDELQKSNEDLKKSNEELKKANSAKDDTIAEYKIQLQIMGKGSKASHD